MSDTEASRRLDGSVLSGLVATHTVIAAAGRAGAQSTPAPGGSEGSGTGASGSGSGNGGGGPVISGEQITDAVVDALEEFLVQLVSPVEGFVEQYGGSVIRVVLETPTPSRVFAAPTNPPWVAVYDYYWSAIVPVALLLFALSASLVILLETTSGLLNGYHRAQLKRRTVVALFGVLSWWWINAFALRLVDGLVVTIAPSLAEVTLFEAVSFGALGVLGIVVSLATDFVLIGVVALLYILRHILIYFYTLLVPLLLVAWIPGVGPFRVVSGLTKQAASLYVPLLVVPVPVALLFRLSLLLGESASVSSLGGFGAWVAALVVPFVAVLAPLVLVWQTGRITAAASVAARNVSRRQASERVGRLRDAGGAVAGRGAQGATGARNLARGVRGATVTDASGRAKLTSGDSRAHAAGTRVRRGLGRVRRRAGGDDERDTEPHEPTDFGEPSDSEER